MRKSSKKRVLILSIMLLVTFLFVCRYIPYIKPVPVEAVEHLDSVLEIHMIDVGQAESILIDAKGKNSYVGYEYRDVKITKCWY